MASRGQHLWLQEVWLVRSLWKDYATTHFICGLSKYFAD